MISGGSRWIRVVLGGFPVVLGGFVGGSRWQRFVAGGSWWLARS